MRILGKLRKIEIDIIKSGLKEEAYSNVYHFHAGDNLEVNIYKLIMAEEFVLLCTWKENSSVIFACKQEIFQYLLQESKTWLPKLIQEEFLWQVGLFLGVNYQDFLSCKFHTKREKFDFLNKHLAKIAQKRYCFQVQKDYSLFIYLLKEKIVLLLDKKITIILGECKEIWEIILQEIKEGEAFSSLFWEKLLPEVSYFLSLSLEEILTRNDLKKIWKFQILKYHIIQKKVSLQRIAKNLEIEEDMLSYQFWEFVWEKIHLNEFSLEKFYTATLIASLN